MNDNRIAVLHLVGDNLGFGAHINPPATGAVGLHNSGSTTDGGARWKIGPGDVLHEFVNCHVRIAKQRHTRTDNFAHIMGWDIGRHAHCNP